MSNIIAFPEPEKLPDIESFPIYYFHGENRIEMPYIPHEKDDACQVLGNFMDLLLQNHIMNENDILQVACEVTGEI